jgi:hypothetical protein
MIPTNPLSEFITDETYDLIKPFLNEVAVRDHMIRTRYRDLRKAGTKAGDAVDIIRVDYPHLQWESIRKITVAKPKKL